MTQRRRRSCPCRLSGLLLAGVAGILRCDHGRLDPEADLDLDHEDLDPAAQLVDPLGSTEGLVLPPSSCSSRSSRSARSSLCPAEVSDRHTWLIWSSRGTISARDTPAPPRRSRV